MTKHKRSYRDKLNDDKGYPKVERLTGAMQKRYGDGTIVIPAPSEIAGLMAKIRKGKLITVTELREHLAQRHGVTMTCPIVTGILTRVVACAAGEDEDEGKVRVLPYWRTLKPRGELNEKYPGGVAQQRARLEAEGHTVVTRGKRAIVVDYETALARLQD
ncbi:MAG: MGMT family protein [Planctomycetes bacterium]|nr:MGMT family protein [Planctomycetota bacterium]